MIDALDRDGYRRDIRIDATVVGYKSERIDECEVSIRNIGKIGRVSFKCTILRFFEDSKGERVVFDVGCTKDEWER